MGRGKAHGCRFAELLVVTLLLHLLTILFHLKNQIMMTCNRIILSVLFASLWMACGDAPESATLKKANEIHNQITQLSADLHDTMMSEAMAIQVEMEKAMLAGDSALMLELAGIEGRMSQWDVRFHDWNATVAEVPGMEEEHSHDHDHDHSGHDHSGHDHGHHSTVSLEGMSDDEVLAIQEALLAELETLRALFEESIAPKVSLEE
jgi:hypothetical protein